MSSPNSSFHSALHARIAESFDRQRLLSTIGARLIRVGEGEVDIELAFSESIVQQHGFAHAEGDRNDRPLGLRLRVPDQDGQRFGGAEC